MEVHWSRRGEAYVTPLGDGLVGVAVLSRERRSYDEHLTAFPRLAAALSGRDAGPVRGAGPLQPAGVGPARPAGSCWSATPRAMWTR